MSEPTEEEVISLVTETFDVSEISQNSERMKFKIEASDFKTKFADLAQRLEDQKIACKIHKKEDGLYLTVRRLEVKDKGILRSSWIQRILFTIVIGFVLVDGYNRTADTNALFYVGEPLEMAIIYTIALMGILGIHELGHLVASKAHKIKTSWPYFIPGIPYLFPGQLLFGIPTFGAVIMAKGLMINREKTFDVAIAGPIAGLVITVIVTVYAAYTAPTIDPLVIEGLYNSEQASEWQLGEPLLMSASFALFGKGGDASVVLMTPLLFAAWVGFFLTFANLMPAGQLDGGHLMRTVLGEKSLRIFTYVSAAILFLINLWFIALFVLMMTGRKSGVTIMDDITPVTKKRKISYAIVMVFAILCAPIPTNFIVIEPVLRLIQQIPSV